MASPTSMPTRIAIMNRLDLISIFFWPRCLPSRLLIASFINPYNSMGYRINCTIRVIASMMIWGSYKEMK